MKKKWNMFVARICYAVGILASIYVGVWMMLLQPIQGMLSAFTQERLTLAFLLVSILKIALSTTLAGLVWCLGYIGYNHFKGTDDPDWEQKNKEQRK